MTKLINNGQRIGALILSFIVVPVTLTTTYNAYHPHFSLETQPDLDKQNVYSTQLLIKNTGMFDAADLEVNCIPIMGPEFDKTSGITMQGMGFRSPSIPLLASGGPGATIPCMFEESHVPEATKFALKVNVKGLYGFGWMKHHFDTDFNYMVMANSEGHYVYNEMP